MHVHARILSVTTTIAVSALCFTLLMLYSVRVAPRVFFQMEP